MNREKEKTKSIFVVLGKPKIKDDISVEIKRISSSTSAKIKIRK